MAERIAWALYLIGAVAVLTSPLDFHKGRWPAAEGMATLIAALFWPIGGLILIASRIARSRRG